MKMIRNLLAAAFLFAGFGAKAQTADEIMAKNIEAMGGAAKLATLNSVKMTGNLSVQGNDVAVTITRLHLKGNRMDLEVMGTSNYRVCNTEKGYTFFPVQQMTEPAEWPADQVKAAQLQLDLHGLFVNYKEKGMTVVSDGAEGNDNKLKVTDKYGNVISYFIDKTTNRVSKVVSIVKDQNGSDVESATIFSNYKQNADGYWFAYTSESQIGVTNFDKAETNIPVDESIFKVN